jgi:hypothetical protein
LESERRRTWAPMKDWCRVNVALFNVVLLG